jgi:hypothetical protein
MQWNYRGIEARAWAALENILYGMVGDGSDVLVHRKVEVFRRESTTLRAMLRCTDSTD